MVFDYIFNFGNLFVLPFWGLMVLVPNWEMTRKIMASYIPFVVLAVLYIYCFVASLDPEKLEEFANPTLAILADLFSDEKVMTTGWVHFLVMDLFVGRWIYLQGQENQLFTRHSLTLCLFAGPMGLLSHVLTSWLAPLLNKASETD